MDFELGKTSLGVEVGWDYFEEGFWFFGFWLLLSELFADRVKAENMDGSAVTAAGKPFLLLAYGDWIDCGVLWSTTQLLNYIAF